MNWSVICKTDANDKFNLKPALRQLVVSYCKSGGVVQVSNNVLAIILEKGLVPTETAVDLLYLAMSVYTADLRIERRFSNDGWSRQITLFLPVAEIAKWEMSKFVLTRMLGFLTGDDWTLEFRQRKITDKPAVKETREPAPSAVSLFSGGLDSFVGAIDLFEETDGIIALVGQYGKDSTNPAQEKTFGVIKDEYLDRALRFGFYVQPNKPGERAAENTMRSRSILFLALGTAVASACAAADAIPLYVPENGLISLNVPLTHSRMGSLSTRTTHPFFISLYRETLAALGIRVSVNLPYKFKTKGEMLLEAKNKKVLAAGLPKTLSCARPDAGRYQKRPKGTHCGYCVPCIIRFASMTAAGFDTRSETYFDVVNETCDPKIPRGGDRRAFEIGIERIKSFSPLQLAAEVLQSGPLLPTDAGEYARVFKRGLEEVADFLKIKR